MKRKKFVSYLDRLCRSWGEEYFGKEAMDQITDEQVETARCEAYKMFYDYIAQYGSDGVGMDCLKELFYNYVFAYYM